MEIPLHERESTELEFKARETLQDRKKLGKEIVAFLNTEGGDLYIGVREEDEVAVAVEPIEDAESEARKLRDSLTDSIEPTPAPGEFEVKVVSIDSSSEILCVQVKRGKYGPYALLGREGARRFWVRIGSRVRKMEWHELAAQFSEGRAIEEGIEYTRRKLLGERDEVQAEGEDQIWCAIQPVRALELNTGDPKVEELLTNPEAIGNSPGDPGFHVPFEPEVRQDRLVLRIKLPGFGADLNRGLKETVVWKDGGIRFRSVLHSLYQHATGSTPRLINPERLIGIPLSLLRLAGALLSGKLEPEDELVVDLALFGVGRADSVLFPSRWGLTRLPREPSFFEDGNDLTLTKPPVFTLGEIRDSPERCTFRLMTLIYEAFGLREDAIPMEFEPRTGRPKVPG